MAIKMITIRMPDSLHAELLEESKREGVSLNLLCVTKLAKPLDWHRQKLREQASKTERDGELPE